MPDQHPTANIFSLRVHPAADVFPMLAEDELKELAADIKANGLLQPIVVAEIDGEEMLIDGRNRRAACKIAEVEPETVGLNGVDPRAYIISVNIHRRHMTKGQQAMAVAMVYPEPEKGGRGKKSPEPVGISQQRVSEARFVLRHAPDLADNVLSGATKLDQAHDDARKLKFSAEGKDARLAKIRAAYPDVADVVMEDDLSLEAAETEVKFRDEQASSIRQSYFMGLANAVNGLQHFTDPDMVDEAIGWLEDETFRKDFLRSYPPGEEHLLKGLDDIPDQFTVFLALMLKIRLLTNMRST